MVAIPGGIELAVIPFVAVLLFGANKIPKVARASGEAIGEFKKGAKESKEQLRDEIDVEGGNDDGDVEDPLEEYLSDFSTDIPAARS